MNEQASNTPTLFIGQVGRTQQIRGSDTAVDDESSFIAYQAV